MEELASPAHHQLSSSAPFSDTTDDHISCFHQILLAQGTTHGVLHANGNWFLEMTDIFAPSMMQLSHPRDAAGAED